MDHEEWQCLLKCFLDTSLPKNNLSANRELTRERYINDYILLSDEQRSLYYFTGYQAKILTEPMVSGSLPAVALLSMVRLTKIAPNYYTGVTNARQNIDDKAIIRYLYDQDFYATLNIYEQLMGIKLEKVYPDLRGTIRRVNYNLSRESRRIRYQARKEKEQEAQHTATPQQLCKLDCHTRIDLIGGCSLELSLDAPMQKNIALSQDDAEMLLNVLTIEADYNKRAETKLNAIRLLLLS